jgi:hypothetical protein
LNLSIWRKINLISRLTGLDRQSVIIYGGQEDGETIVKNPLYVLNVNNFNWHIPKVIGKIPSSRTSHKAELIGKYMVITFGKIY